MRDRVLRGLFLVALLGCWAVGARVADNPLVPTPWEVVESLVENARSGVLVHAVTRSMARLAVGFGVSLVLGISLGLALARSRIVKATLGTLVLGLQAVPSICWLPIALLCFGLSEMAIQVVVVLGALLSIAIGTEGAIRTVPPVYLRAARTMGASGARLWLRVILPAALPGILSSARLGWTFAWRSLMAGELLFLSGGLGQVLETGRELNDMAQVVAVMLVIVALGLLSENILFERLERRVRARRGLDRE